MHLAILAVMNLPVFENLIIIFEFQFLQDVLN